MAIRFDARQNSITTDGATIEFDQSVTFPASTASAPSLNIPEGAAPSAPVDSDDWNTAFGWGDHSTEGYLTTISGGDHGSLAGLADNDHPQYALLTGAAFTGAITATSYGGITEANLLDKSATETITANWTIDPDTTGPFLTLGDGTSADGDSLLRLNIDRAWAFKQSSSGSTTGLTLQSEVDSKQFNIRGPAGNTHFYFQIGDASNPNFRIFDSGGTDYAQFSHDGTDFNTTLGNTTDWNITGITAIQAGTVDADFDAITATSYGGITEANLLDKSAAETVSGNWTHSGGLSGGSNTQNGNYTLVLSDAGKTIHKASGGAGETYTIPANSSVAFPIGTAVAFSNSGGGTLTIAITTDTLVKADDGSTGSRTLADDGLAVAIKVASTTWKIAGDQLT